MRQGREQTRDRARRHIYLMGSDTLIDFQYSIRIFRRALALPVAVPESIHSHATECTRTLANACATCPPCVTGDNENDIFAGIEIMVLRRDNGPPRLDYVRRPRCNYMPCHVRSELGKANSSERE